MQIGNPGDPAYSVLKQGKENSSLILSELLAEDLNRNSIGEPILNIRAGIAYLLTRMAKFRRVTVPDSGDTQVHEYKVVPGDSLDRIAHKVGSTVDVTDPQS